MASATAHALAAYSDKVQIPTQHNSVFNEECLFSFDGPGMQINRILKLDWIFYLIIELPIQFYFVSQVIQEFNEMFNWVSISYWIASQSRPTGSTSVWRSSSGWARSTWLHTTTAPATPSSSTGIMFGRLLKYKKDLWIYRAGQPFDCDFLLRLFEMLHWLMDLYAALLVAINRENVTRHR